ncbi:MAG: DUF4296 domain-containing protein [Bacteroidota bacterium]
MKVKGGWFAFVVVCWFSSCNLDKKPPGVLGKQELAEVLVELYAGEARMSGLAVVPDSSLKLFQPFEEELLRKRGIPDSIMKITYRYYVAHPVDLEQVYDVVIDTLTLREQRGRAGRLRPKKERKTP